MIFKVIPVVSLLHLMVIFQVLPLIIKLDDTVIYILNPQGLGGRKTLCDIQTSLKFTDT